MTSLGSSWWLNESYRKPAAHLFTFLEPQAEEKQQLSSNHVYQSGIEND